MGQLVNLTVVALVVFEHFNEGVLGNVDLADCFHFGFTFFLLFEQLALTGDVATIAFGGHVFTHG